MGNVTISDLEQIQNITNNTKLACENAAGNTSSIELGQILDFLQAPVIPLQVSGTGPNFFVNPQVNVIHTLNLNSLTSSQSVTINLPAGNLTRETQIVIKCKNINYATINIAGLEAKFPGLDLTRGIFQLILDYDQNQRQWVAGTLPIVGV